MQYRDDWIEFLPWNTRSRTRFHHDAHEFTDLHLLRHAKIVDVTYKNSSIYVVSQATPSVVPVPPSQAVVSIHDLYRDLPPDIQRIVGTIQWPDPHKILDVVDSIRSGTAMGVSDGSVRLSENRASHAYYTRS